MLDRGHVWRLLIGAVILAAVESTSAITINLASTLPAQAQLSGYPYRSQQRQHSDSGKGFFQLLFGNFEQPPTERDRGRLRVRRAPVQRVDHSHAPKPRQANRQIKPTTTIVVMGDGMADWLAYGLEDAFSDSPEVAIQRDDKPHSGLIHYQPRSDLNWWNVARDLLAKQNANYVVMMLGLNDRQSFDERDVAAEIDKGTSNQSQRHQQQMDAAEAADDTKAGEDILQAAPLKLEPMTKTRSKGPIKFRSDRWVEIYTRRIDETIAALKSKNVPVFWVGLPSIRGARSTADAVFLNNLYRNRAETAGIVYIDVWGGFVDDKGRYSSFGPDYEGQTRRLRSADGVYFTKYGARKLAHYVEREIRRYMNNRTLTVAFPAGSSAPGLGNSIVHPLVGPVVPLMAVQGNVDELAGGADMLPPPVPHGTVAARVLIKGDPLTAPPGRADDFAWPPGRNTYKAAKPVAAKPATAAVAVMPASGAIGPAVKGPSPVAPRHATVGKTVQVDPPRPKRFQVRRTRRQDDIPRPPALIGQ